MKYLKIIVSILVISLILSVMSSCDVTKVADMSIQMLVNFEPVFSNRSVPASSNDFSDLNSYKEYSDNKEDIDKANILHFNFSIDSIKAADNNLKIEDIVFDTVSFYLTPATADGTPIEGQRYKLGEINSMHAVDYYKTAKHIILVSDEVSSELSEQIKKTPYFIFTTQYSNLVGESSETKFDYIGTNIDMIVRVTLK